MILNKTGIPYGDYAWNPAPGCTARCPGCWARQMAARGRRHCAQCGDFTPHIHAERIDQDRPKDPPPSTVLVNFMGDLFDPGRDTDDIARVLMAAWRNPRHTYVFLTQNVPIMAATLGGGPHPAAGPWYLGATVRNQQEAARRLPALAGIPCKHRWASIEPIRGPIDLFKRGDPAQPHGHLALIDCVNAVIVGSDNTPGRGPFDPAWVLKIVRQCREADVDVYVKQIITHHPDGRDCLVTDPAEFPPFLRRRELAWPVRGK